MCAEYAIHDSVNEKGERKHIPEQESAVVENDTCASSLPKTTVRRTIGKTTYIANLHFKEQGQTFSEKLKRYLDMETMNIVDTQMYIDGYQMKLVSDTSYGSLWEVSFTLKEF